MKKLVLFIFIELVFCAGVAAQKPVTHPSKTTATKPKPRKRTTTTTTATKPKPRLKIDIPSEPSPIGQTERKITDLLFFPLGCMPKDITTYDGLISALNSTFGKYEKVNLLDLGFHNCDVYNYTYRGIPVGVVETRLGDGDDQNWFYFYFDTSSAATKFYNTLGNDIKATGIPLTYDRIYGGLSNRKNPVSVFKWVYIDPPQKVTEACCNIHTDDVIGKYFVQLGVYKR